MKDRCTVGKAVVVKFSPWEEKTDSWSDVSSIHCLTCTYLHIHLCALLPIWEE